MRYTADKIAATLVHLTPAQLTKAHEAGKRARQMALQYYKHHGFPIPATVISWGRSRAVREQFPADMFWQFMIGQNFIKPVKVLNRVCYLPCDAGLTPFEEVQAVELMELALFQGAAIPLTHIKYHEPKKLQHKRRD